MRGMLAVAALAALIGMAAPQSGSAQEAGDGLIEVGAMAPDFELTGATRHGVLQDPVRLSDYRGERSSWRSSSESGRVAERFK